LKEKEVRQLETKEKREEGSDRGEEEEEEVI